MNLSVQVREDEDLEYALRRFQTHVDRELSIPWKRRRYGYYEKPSALRRKVLRRDPIRLPLRDQWARTGPLNAAGR